MGGWNVVAWRGRRAFRWHGLEPMEAAARLLDWMRWGATVVASKLEVADAAVGRLGREGDMLALYIPDSVAERLGLEPGDEVSVLIVKTRGARRGGPLRRANYGGLNVVECPRCGEEGRVRVVWSHPRQYVYVAHGGRLCSLGPLEAVREAWPEIAEVVEKMRKVRESWSRVGG